MKKLNGDAIVTTIQERCRVCYTCVRECPAKAIRISEGQAQVIGEKCIGCGHCVKVCSQGAKKIYSSIEGAKKILAGSRPVAAIIAPSFPVEFEDVPYKNLVGALRKLGFSFVCEVAFGADLVARAYRQLIAEAAGRSYIATTCPAVVAYVEKYHPQLVSHLAPIVSPMVAMARVLKKIHGPKIKVVFVGPCVAKKGERKRADVEHDVDKVLTFVELKELLAEAKIDLNSAEPSEFDPPQAGSGRLFALSRGMLQTANVTEDLVSVNVINADGKEGFKEAIKEFKRGYCDTTLLDTLCCEGCIQGAGITSKAPLYRRRYLVSNYVREKLKTQSAETVLKSIQEFQGLDLSCRFAAHDQRIPNPSDAEIKMMLVDLGKKNADDELNCGACGYSTCRKHAIAILRGFAEAEMCLPYTIERLKNSVSDLQGSYKELKRVREALDQREKLASMGQLAAGIAHEINNPLGIVLMYCHLLSEQAQIEPRTREDIALIVEQANRCKKIVSGLLNFARQNKVLREPTQLVELVQRCLSAVVVPDSIKTTLVTSLADPQADIDRDQISQVLGNLFNNAIDAMPDGGELKIEITGTPESVTLLVSDTGMGIPEKHLGRIFTPFFTTKQIGKGTGLGLPVCYGIVKMHSGNIQVKSNDDISKGPTGTAVTVQLPRLEAKAHDQNFSITLQGTQT